MQDSGLVRKEDLANLRQDTQFAAALTARDRAFSSINAILVVDTAGDLVAASESGRGPHDDDAIRQLIAGLSRAAPDRAMALMPATDRGSNVVYIAIRLADDAGTVTGATVLVFDPGWFASVLSEIERSMPVLLSLDFSGDTGNGQRLVSSKLSLDPDGGIVSAAADAGTLGLTVTASQSRTESLALWRRQLWNTAIFLSVWELTLLAGYLAIRRWEIVARRAQAARTAALASVREAEEEARTARIREKERAIEAIFDNGAVGFAEVALPDSRFVRFNRRFCEMTGRNAADLLGGLTPRDIYHPDDRVSFDAAMQMLHEKGSTERSVRYLHADGRVIWAHVGVKISAVDDNGRATRLIAVVQDISAVKQAAEEIRERETLLRLCMQIGHVGTFWRRFGEDQLHLSEEASNILGLPEGTRRASYGSLERNMSEADAARIREAVTSARGRGAHDQAFSFRFVRPCDGVARHVEVRVRYDYDDDGRHGATGVMIDVTETRKAEALLRLSLQISRVGTFRHDFASQTVDCDATTRELCGLPPDNQPIPKDVWWGYVLPEDRKLLEAGLAESAAAHAMESRRDYRIRRADDGSIRHVTARVYLEYGTDGQLVSASGVIIDMTDRYEAEAKIAHLARHDVLTDLPNRTVLRERTDAAAAASRRGQGFALLMIDLDRFKHVNDTLGHPVGDALLQAVATRLLESVRETDTVARLGGDEFAVLMPGLSEPHEIAATVADRIVAAISRPFQIGEHIVEIGSSVGIAIAPGDGSETDDINKAADLALYRAKTDGRGCWRFFEAAMDSDMRRRRYGEFDLRRAFVADEFDLVYQPMVDLDSRRALGVEAQIVWRHPQRGTVPAEAFAAFAEELGILKDIGSRLLARACLEAATWVGAPTLAFAVSSRQFYKRNFVATVIEALEAASLPADRLELRIAEATLTAPGRNPLPVLEDLSRHGVALGIAEVGSGRSILGLLARHRFDRVLVDCVPSGSQTGPDLAAIMPAVSRLGDSVGSGCGVSGIETEAERRLAEREGFRTAQGLLFGAPMSSGEIRSYLLGERAGPPAARSAASPAGTAGPERTRIGTAGLTTGLRRSPRR
ncbi:MAG: diguanylate cyclase [Ancalomicrobiaceae bacterium]|nr:diguanylate cyclase [Ancalomicrobiaceae bacterium]